MKIKTLLLTAAAFTVAGIVSLQAQVYSQNVVGYANLKTSSGNQYLIAVPFNIGASNGANEIWPLDVGNNPTLPDYSQIAIWNGTGYDSYLSDSTSPSLWDDVNYNNLPGAPVLPVGQGFFLIPSGDTTNVFAGTVAVNVGTSNKTAYTSGNQYLVSPKVPYAGSITNGNLTTGVGGPNLWSPDGVAGLPDYSQIAIWNGTGYDSYLSDSSSTSLWDDVNYNNLQYAPQISVGQGFFLIPSGNYNWTIGL